MSTSATETTSAQGGALRGALAGLAPIAFFVVLAALTGLATVLVRTLVSGQPFLTQLPELGATLGIGLALAFAAWIAGFIWALRRQRAWAMSGSSAAAAATLWALTVSALILLAPVIVAILLPQHPAHPAAP
jgi:hypothetical protein